MDKPHRKTNSKRSGLAAAPSLSVDFANPALLAQVEVGNLQCDVTEGFLELVAVRCLVEV